MCLALLPLTGAAAKAADTNASDAIEFAPGLLKVPPSPTESRIAADVFRRFPDVDARSVMDFISREFPEDRTRFTLLSLQNATEASALLSGLIRQTLELMAMEKAKPDLYAKLLKQRKLDRRAVELGQAYRRAKGDDKAVQMKKLQDVLAESFEIKQELMRDDVAQMEQQINELKLLLQKREGSRQAIIDLRAGELTGETGALKW
jgi:replicative DNA helicase